MAAHLARMFMPRKRAKNYSSWSVEQLEQAIRFQRQEPASKYPGVDRRRKALVETMRRALDERKITTAKEQAMSEVKLKKDHVDVLNKMLEHIFEQGSGRTDEIIEKFLTFDVNGLQLIINRIGPITTIEHKAYNEERREEYDTTTSYCLIEFGLDIYCEGTVATFKIPYSDDGVSDSLSGVVNKIKGAAKRWGRVYDSLMQRPGLFEHGLGTKWLHIYD